MNCKPGDLAVVVKTMFGEYIGTIVDVKAKGQDFQGKPTWVCEAYRPIPTIDISTGKRTKPTKNLLCPDAWLRPIRDNDGEDEMLRIAGKPQREIA